MLHQALSLRKYAVEQSYLREMSKNGVAVKYLVSEEMIENAARARLEQKYAERIYNFIRGSTQSGRPKIPSFREEIPENLDLLLQKAKALREGYDLVSDPARKNKIEEASVINKLMSDLRDEAETKIKKYREIAKQKEASVKKQREDLLGAPSLPRSVFGLGRRGEKISVTKAPFNWHPMANKLFMQEDIDFMQKHYGDITDDLWGEAVRIVGSLSHATAPVRNFQTVYDLGFILTNGLTLLGNDFSHAADPRYLPGFGKAINKVSGGKIPNKQFIWPKTVWNSLMSLRNKENIAKWWEIESSRNIEEWDAFKTYARIGGIPSDLSEISLVEKAIGADKLQRTFTNYLNSSAWLYWKSSYHLAGKNPKKLEELGALTRNLIGIHATAELGAHSGQQAAERFFFFAPAFFRASLAVMAQAIFQPTTLSGRQALRSLAGLSGAMTMGVVAASLIRQTDATGDFDMKKVDFDDLVDDVKAAWTPGANFWGYEVGNTFIGLGGPMRSNLQLMARLLHAGIDWNPSIDHPLGTEFDLDLANLFPVLDGKNLFQHPITQMYRTKAGIIPGTAWTLITGRDFLGYRMDRLSDFDKYLIDKTPFWVNNYLDANSGLLPSNTVSVTVMLSAFLGVRTSPQSPGAIFWEKVEKESGMTRDEINAKYDDGNKMYGEYLEDLKTDAKNYPETVAAYNDYQKSEEEKGSEYKELYDAKIEDNIKRSKEIAEIWAEVDFTIPGSGEKAREATSDIYDAHSDNYPLLVERILGKEEAEEFFATGENPTSPMGLIWEYRTNPEKYFITDTISGYIDYDAQEAAIAEQVNLLEPKERQAFLADEGKYTVGQQDAKNYEEGKYEFVNEGMERQKAAREVYDQYNNASKYKGMTIEESDRVDALIETVDQARAMLSLARGGKSVSRKDVLKKLVKLVPGNKVVQYALILSYDNLARLIKSDIQTTLFLDNPDLAVFYPKTYWYASEDEQEEWNRKFGMGGYGYQSRVYKDLFAEEIIEREERKKRGGILGAVEDIADTVLY
jgi:hypothetical protein